MSNDKNADLNGLKTVLTKLIVRVRSYNLTNVIAHEFREHAKFYGVSFVLTIVLEALILIITSNKNILAYGTIILYVGIIIYLIHLYYNDIILIVKKYIIQLTSKRCKYCGNILEADIIHIRKDLRMSDRCFIIDRENFDLDSFIEEAIKYYNQKKKDCINQEEITDPIKSESPSMNSASQTKVKTKQVHENKIVNEQINEQSIVIFDSILEAINYRGNTQSPDIIDVEILSVNTIPIEDSNMNYNKAILFNNLKLFPCYKEPLSLPPASDAEEYNNIANLIQSIKPPKYIEIQTKKNNSMENTYLNMNHLDLINKFTKDPEHFTSVIKVGSEFFNLMAKLVEKSLDSTVIKVSKSEFQLINDLFLQCQNMGLLDNNSGYYPIRDEILKELLRDYYFNPWKYQQLAQNDKSILNVMSKRFNENNNLLINSHEKNDLYDIKRKCDDLNIL